MKQLCDLNITFLHFYITSFLFTVEQIKMERITNFFFYLSKKDASVYDWIIKYKWVSYGVIFQ